MLLAELIRIDLKTRADPRQIRNIDFSKKLKAAKKANIKDTVNLIEKSLSQATK
jgi:hypothetical protein